MLTSYYQPCMWHFAQQRKYCQMRQPLYFVQSNTTSTLTYGCTSMLGRINSSPCGRGSAKLPCAYIISNRLSCTGFPCSSFIFCCLICASSSRRSSVSYLSAWTRSTLYSARFSYPTSMIFFSSRSIFFCFASFLFSFFASFFCFSLSEASLDHCIGIKRTVARYV